MYIKFKSQLSKIYDPEEAEQIAILAFENVMNYRRIDISLNKEEKLNDKQLKSFEQILSGLNSGKPIQYVLGNSWFYGMNLMVNQHVLIPRRETEELVAWILKDIRAKGKLPDTILDICTGSGCIALALKKEFHEIKIVACDISEQALAVARYNAIKQNLDIDFTRMDALNITSSMQPDIVVCNPPYVLNSEKDVMKKNVIDHEPSLALFVPDSDALVFYRHISEWANKGLISGSKIYFEINEKMGDELEKLLSTSGFINIEIRKDFQNKDRMIRGTKA